MRIGAVVAVIVVIAAGGALYFLSAPDVRAPRETSTDGEAWTSEPVAPRRETRPRSRAAEPQPAPAEAPRPPSESDRVWAEARQAERLAARRLAPLLAERDERNRALAEAGMLAADDELAARIERVFNDSVATSGEERKGALDALEALAHELKTILQRKVDVGVLAESDGKSAVGSIAALRGGVRWYERALVEDAARGLAPAAVGETAAAAVPETTAAAGDRAALAKSIRETRQEGLRAESALLDRLLASESAGAQRVGAQIRRLLVRAQLGEMEYAEARRQADELLTGARGDLDPAAQEDLSSLAGLIDWYGGPVMRKLRGD